MEYGPCIHLPHVTSLCNILTLIYRQEVGVARNQLVSSTSRMRSNSQLPVYLSRELEVQVDASRATYFCSIHPTGAAAFRKDPSSEDELPPQGPSEFFSAQAHPLGRIHKIATIE